MKVWNKVKYPLLIGLIVVLFALVRALAYTLPSGALTILYPLILIRLLSQDWFDSDILFDILLLAAVFFAVMYVPGPEKWGKFRRYLLRPAVAVLVTFGLSAAAVTGYQALEDWTYQKNRDTTYQNIADFLDEADEAIAYNTHSHHFDDRFRDAFPELLLETTHIIDNEPTTVYYYSDYILIDYDTQRIGFIYHQYGTLKFYEYQLKPADAYPELGRQRTIDLPDAGAELRCYRPGPTLSQYTDGFALTLSDGSIYTVTGLCRGTNFYLGLKDAQLTFLEIP